jgi:hypothetical protein
MSWPPQITRPEVGRLLPVMSSKSVVLPDPFGPRSPTIEGSAISKSASSRNVGSRRSKPRV